jgi:hypothetical protein
MDYQSSRGAPSGVRWGALGVAALCTCVAALYNHFPLTYPDSGNYLDNAIDLLHGKKPWFFFRPLTYGVLLMPFATRLTIWLLPFAQGLLVAVSVDLALRTAGVRLSSRTFVVLLGGLSVLTSLSWFSGQIMPDVFTPVVILLSFVVVWTSGQGGSRRLQMAMIILTLGIASHLSHFPLFAALLPATIFVRLGLDQHLRAWRPAADLVARGTVPLLAAGLIVLASNHALHRQPVLSRSSELFALARLVGDGAAQRYLETACPAHPYSLCADRSRLKADMDRFLWDPDGPRARSEAAMARGDSSLLREAPAIVAGTLRQEWRAVLRHALRDIAIQSVTFGVHPGEQAFSPSVESSMRRLSPALGAAFDRSRQARNAIPSGPVSVLHYAVVCVGFLAIVVALPALRDPADRPLLALSATVAAGLVANAVVIGSLSTVHPRYQSRVIWLIPLLGAVAFLRLLERRRWRRGTPGESGRPGAEA